MKRYVAITLLLLFSYGATYAQDSKLPVPGREQPEQVVTRTYPNPATSFITFEFKMPVERGWAISIFSFLGRKMTQLPVNANRLTINLNEYFTGIYVYQVRDKDGRILSTNKFQVVK